MVAQARGGRGGGGQPDRIEYLASMPTPSSVYAAAVGRSARAVVRSSIAPAATTPALALRTGPVRLDRSRADAYCRLIGETVNDAAVPPGLVHVTGFGLQLALLARPDFPLPMLGLVHIANRVEQLEPVTVGGEYVVTVWARHLAQRPLSDGAAGTHVEVVTEVRLTDEDGPVVWQGVSTYLAKSIALSGVPVVAVPERLEFSPPIPTGGWSTSLASSREYARVSGDRNPIHTSRIGARAFGFARTIAHGMDTAARALAPLARERAASFTWSVEFAAPAVVPGRVSLRVERAADLDESELGRRTGWRMTAWDPRRGRPHLAGSLASA